MTREYPKAPEALQLNASAGVATGHPHLLLLESVTVKQADIDRFHSYQVPVTESGCFLWIGAVGKNGYGQMGLGGKIKAAHRLAVEIRDGSIPDGMLVCHKCDTPTCVNPDHLFVGTMRDNVADMCRKGRRPKGEKDVRSVLTESAVREILASTKTHAALAAHYGVATSTISMVKNRRNWKHVTLPGEKT